MSVQNLFCEGPIGVQNLFCEGEVYFIQSGNAILGKSNRKINWERKAGHAAK